MVVDEFKVLIITIRCPHATFFLHAISQVVFPKNLVTGTPSQYTLYMQNLAASGDGSVPKRPWVSYPLQAALYFIPIALLAYFITRHFVVLQASSHK